MWGNMGTPISISFVGRIRFEFMLVVMTRLVSACEDIQILLTCVLYEVWKIKVEPICFNLCLKMKYLALNYIIGSFHKQ